MNDREITGFYKNNEFNLEDNHAIHKKNQRLTEKNNPLKSTREYPDREKKEFSTQPKQQHTNVRKFKNRSSNHIVALTLVLNDVSFRGTVTYEIRICTS